MTVPTQSDQTPAIESKNDSKELNFRRQESTFLRIIAEKDSRIAEIEKQLQQKQIHEDEDDDEPYVNKKKLEKQFAKFGQQAKQETQSEIQRAVENALRKEKKDNWLKNHSDFSEVLQHADKLLLKDPELAESILEMPEGFERQKLVYKNIKALELDKPALKQPSIQDKMEANRRSPYYQPSGVANAPYSSQSDFSPTGQKQAYEKMQELKSKLRI